uniref:Bm703 n=1 Tax=Brugia malayi TaxID=6279 RepID=A0A1I9G519_BRUMA|nr:Bm703 [Brugia malayi]
MTTTQSVIETLELDECTCVTMIFMHSVLGQAYVKEREHVGNAILPRQPPTTPHPFLEAVYAPS